MLWFSCIFIALVGTLILINKVNRSKQRELQLDGLMKVVELKSLISLLQQHRGMSSALLNGDTSVEAKLCQLDGQISSLINNLDNTDIGQLNSRWPSFLDHWHRLKQINDKTDSLNNFKQHTQLIANLLYLLEDEAEHSLLTSANITELPTLGYVWRELVQAAENVGQSRAIGTGVATQGSCDQVDKIRLSFLEQHISQTSSKILNQLSCTEGQSSKHQKLVSNAASKMTNLTTVISSELLSNKEVKINQSEYFNIASETISALNDIFDHQVQQVRQLI